MTTKVLTQEDSGSLRFVDFVETFKQYLKDYGPPAAESTPGLAGTIKINGVTTLPSGENAWVKNVGTDTAAVLDFGIPQGAPGSPGTGSVGASAFPATVNFDTFFAGSTDSAKITAMNNWAKGNPNAIVVFAARQYNFNVAIMLYSGLKLLGTAGFPAREYSRCTIFNWQGPAGSSMLDYPATQTGQSYPSDNSPRDITMTGIQFQGPGSTDFLPKLDPGNYRGKTLWYCNFHNCGWKHFRTVWWGAGTGTSFATGTSHFQQIQDSAFWVGGSENTFFGGDSFCFAGDNNPVLGKPFFRSSLQKSRIGLIMITSRKSNFQLQIEGGGTLTVDSVYVDAQSGDPVYGPGIKITGGEGITINNCCFKGMATQGAKGWIEISGGSNINISNNNFQREGNNAPAADFPVVHVSGSASQVAFGLNTFDNFGSTKPVVYQDAAGKVFNVSPWVQVKP